MPDRLPISLVTTCKGRLAHLKRTLPGMLALPIAEVIVVDYDCPERTGDWVAKHRSAAKVVRVADRPHFNAAKARNLGAAAATSPWLFFVDADTRMERGLGDDLAAKLKQAGGFYVPEPRTADLYGAILLPRADFDAVGGYDEVFEGWAIEDVELWDRLLARGVARGALDGRRMRAIEHDNKLRARFHDIGDSMATGTLNNVYRWVKADLHRLGFDLDPTALKTLYDQLRAGLESGTLATEYEVAFRDVPTFGKTLQASLTYRLVDTASAAPTAATPFVKRLGGGRG